MLGALDVTAKLWLTLLDTDILVGKKQDLHIFLKIKHKIAIKYSALEAFFCHIGVAGGHLGGSPVLLLLTTAAT